MTALAEPLRLAIDLTTAPAPRRTAHLDAATAGERLRQVPDQVARRQAAMVVADVLAGTGASFDRATFFRAAGI